MLSLDSLTGYKSVIYSYYIVLLLVNSILSRLQFSNALNRVRGALVASDSLDQFEGAEGPAFFRGGD